MFTDLDLNEIKRIENEDINQQKILLANETTRMLYGYKETKDAESIAKNSFSENSTGEHLPDTKVDKRNVGSDIINFVSLIDKKLSKSEIRRLVKSDGIKINNVTISDEKFTVSQNLFDKNKFIKLSIGKKKHFKVVF